MLKGDAMTNPQTPSVPDFHAFKRAALADGFDETRVRTWAPLETVPEHRHDFAARALVVEGEMWLTQAGQTRHLVAGDTFVLSHNEPHSERYGANGATYWVARRSQG